MVINNNMHAIIAHNRYTENTAGLRKALERMSSGLRINRAADDPTGLVVSEKMRSQIRGLTQAISNAESGKDLLNTADGGIDAIIKALQQMREWAVQSANGTYENTSREALHESFITIRDGIDTQVSITEFNRHKLLDGSLSGAGSSNTSHGPRFGTQVALDGTGANSLDGSHEKLNGMSVASSISGVEVKFTTDNGLAEGARWSSPNELNINLRENIHYNQSQINDLINRAWSGDSIQPPQVSVRFDGSISDINADIDPTVGGVRAASPETSLTDFGMPAGSTIQFISNNYGEDTRTFNIVSSASPVPNRPDAVIADNRDTLYARDGEFTIHLSTRTEGYTARQIENLLREAGLDYSVVIGDGASDNVFFAQNSNKTVTFQMGEDSPGNGRDGAGVGSDRVIGTGQGMTLHIGPNASAENRISFSINDLSVNALGLGSLRIDTATDAEKAITAIDEALDSALLQRARIGAIVNRLDHTIGNLTTSHENLTAANSRIRDADMAKEIINFTTQNIRQQAALAMIAQANQMPQQLLQLFGI